jgi:hypothetical protein
MRELRPTRFIILGIDLGGVVRFALNNKTYHYELDPTLTDRGTWGKVFYVDVAPVDKAEAMLIDMWIDANNYKTWDDDLTIASDNAVELTTYRHLTLDDEDAKALFSAV